jgi:hypothetical protein
VARLRDNRDSGPLASALTQFVHNDRPRAREYESECTDGFGYESVRKASCSNLTPSSAAGDRSVSDLNAVKGRVPTKSGHSMVRHNRLRTPLATDIPAEGSRIRLQESKSGWRASRNDCAYAKDRRRGIELFISMSFNHSTTSEFVEFRRRPKYHGTGNIGTFERRHSSWQR